LDGQQPAIDSEEVNKKVKKYITRCSFMMVSSAHINTQHDREPEADLKTGWDACLLWIAQICKL